MSFSCAGRVGSAPAPGQGREQPNCSQTVNSCRVVISPRAPAPGPYFGRFPSVVLGVEAGPPAERPLSTSMPPYEVCTCLTTPFESK